jgi:pimeloyl-ACP methyl ester carboxylesterase
MKKGIILGVLTGFLFAVAAQFSLNPVLAQGDSPVLTVLDQEGGSVAHLTDGDLIRLRLTLPQAAGGATPVAFTLKGVDKGMAECIIPARSTSCDTDLFASLGWYWDAQGSPQANRVVIARAQGTDLVSSALLTISPRPVVMVHGFSSSWEAWAAYLGPNGFLSGVGIPAYAVGDGQFPGTLNTGRIDQPAGKTNTIAENAAILGDYIQEVLKATGAHKVDLLVHSMGGLIARYYIDRVVQNGEVAQLIMLGSPMAGTACANLPASLNFYLPAALEIQPLYVADVFNQQITHRKGIPFHALAGVPLQKAISSPCTPVPSDMAVSLESVDAIPLELSQMPVLHTELNTSQQVFHDYVLPLLQTPAGSFPAPQPDPAPLAANIKPLQFSRIYTGHIAPGDSRELVINIEAGVSVASFALYDPSHSLDTVVRGASGKVIELSSEANGLVKVEDPSMMLNLGYGFNNPKPGAWKVTLLSTQRTPPAGADYALTAVFQGGVQLQTQTSLLLPRLNQPVQLTAALSLNGEALPIESVQVSVRLPDGARQQVNLAVSGNQATGAWTPAQAGLNYFQIDVSGRAPDNTPVERSAFLVVEAQPQSGPSRSTFLLIGGILIGGVAGGAGLLIAIGLWIWRKRRRQASF